MRTVEGHVSVPTVGFGTYAPGDTSWCYEATLHALKAGYRHLDCAWEYGVNTIIYHSNLLPISADGCVM